jgi:peptidoglycan/LPS O-acetylase OafA/YrhL
MVLLFLSNGLESLGVDVLPKTLAKVSVPHLTCLDRLRGLAIFGVFWFHVLGATYGAHELPLARGWSDFQHPPGDWTFFLFFPCTYGWAGVPLFFVISGFCIHLSHAPAKDTWGFFYNRRFWRIYPPYLVVLLLAAAGNYFFADSWRNIWVSGAANGFYQLGTHVLLIHNFFPDTIYTISPAYWSIAIEAQLYLLYIVLFLLASRLSWGKVLALTAAIDVGLWLLNDIAPSVTSDTWFYFATRGPLLYVFSWTLGAFMAERFRTREFWLAPSALVWLSAAAFVVATSSEKFQALGFSLAAIGSFFYMSRTITRETQGLLSQHIWTYHFAEAGKVSYSFYLIHQPLVRVYCLALLKFCPHRWVVMLAAPAVWFVIFLLSQVAYRRLEKPSIAMGYRFWSAVTANKKPEPLPARVS